MATKAELEELLNDAQEEIKVLKEQLKAGGVDELPVTASDIRAAKTAHQNCLRKGLIVCRKDGFFCKYHNIDIYA